MNSKSVFIDQGVAKGWGCCSFLGDRLKEEAERVKIRGHRGGGDNHFFNSLKINFFSVSSVV